MKLTTKQLRQIIKEELSLVTENTDMPELDNCPKLDKKIKDLLMSSDKETIIHGMELYHTLHMGLFNIKLDVHGGTPRGGIPDPRVHIEFKGPDSEKFMKCLSLEALLPRPSEIDRYLDRFKKMGKFKFSFIPNVGGRYSTWIKTL